MTSDQAKVESLERVTCQCPMDWQLCFAQDCPRAPISVRRGTMTALTARAQTAEAALQSAQDEAAREKADAGVAFLRLREVMEAVELAERWMADTIEACTEQASATLLPRDYTAALKIVRATLKDLRP